MTILNSISADVQVSIENHKFKDEKNCAGTDIENADDPGCLCNVCHVGQLDFEAGKLENN